MLAWGYIRHWGATMLHKFWVAWNLARWILSDYPRALRASDDAAPFFWLELTRRALIHDFSKFRRDEAAGFARTIDRLKSTTYGTEAYKALLREIKPSIKLHYARNRHHPEHWAKGYADMSRADRIEMVADWGAAVRRNANGNLDESMTKNAERFHYGPEDERWLRATAHRMGLL